MAACSDQDLTDGIPEESVPAGDIIQIGGLDTSGLEVSANSGGTRAITYPAETLPWLVDPLKTTGLDITYWKDDQESTTKRVAILKLLNNDSSTLGYDTDPTTGWALYSFKYKTAPTEAAVWYGNGAHRFEGQYVPNELRYGSAITDRTTLASVNNSSAKDIISNQSKSTNGVDNYTLLERYLAMPANTRISATLGRVKLPFRHRLARVLAFVLIDPSMGNVKLKGFNEVDGKDDPNSTSITFNRVEVLTGVQDELVDGNHVLTPQWKQERKVVPHYVSTIHGSVDEDLVAIPGYENNFVMFYDDTNAEYIFPTDEDWSSYISLTDAQLSAKKITKTEYGQVPVYDLIVRPTYTSIDSVMYDEACYHDATEKAALVTHKNKIEFELTLNNNLTYEKVFEFDLNANYQTVVYLRIGRESVDYNASGSAIWKNSLNQDDWYGVDNSLGHSLSIAGSSWQRAFTYGKYVSDDKVTDGGFYNETTTSDDGVDGQYLKPETWIKKFAQACETGEHHGDYFILTSDIEIDARDLPDNFIFTGHLDAMGHKITLTNAGTAWTEWKKATDYSSGTFYATKDESAAPYTLPALYTQNHANYDDDSELYQIGDKWYLKSTLQHVLAKDAVYWTEEDAAKENAKHQETDAEGNPLVDGEGNPLYADGYSPVKGGDVKEPAVVDHYELKDDAVEKKDITYDNADVSLAEVMSAAENTYFTNQSGTPFVKPTLYTKTEHTSGTALFAGLNGNYTAADGVANVHTESGVQIPYITPDSNFANKIGSGWRAEVMNLLVVGAPMFMEGATITGNVQNCKQTITTNGQSVTTKVENHTPELPVY